MVCQRCEISKVNLLLIKSGKRALASSKPYTHEIATFKLREITLAAFGGAPPEARRS